MDVQCWYVRNMDSMKKCPHKLAFSTIIISIIGGVNSYNFRSHQPIRYLRYNNNENTLRNGQELLSGSSSSSSSDSQEDDNRNWPSFGANYPKTKQPSEIGEMGIPEQYMAVKHGVYKGNVAVFVDSQSFETDTTTPKPTKPSKHTHITRSPVKHNTTSRKPTITTTPLTTTAARSTSKATTRSYSSGNFPTSKKRPGKYHTSKPNITTKHTSTTHEPSSTKEIHTTQKASSTTGGVHDILVINITTPRIYSSLKKQLAFSTGVPAKNISKKITFTSNASEFTSSSTSKPVHVETTKISTMATSASSTTPHFQSASTSLRSTSPHLTISSTDLSRTPTATTLPSILNEKTTTLKSTRSPVFSSYSSTASTQLATSRPATQMKSTLKTTTSVTPQVITFPVAANRVIVQTLSRNVPKTEKPSRKKSIPTCVSYGGHCRRHSECCTNYCNWRIGMRCDYED